MPGRFASIFGCDNKSLQIFTYPFSAAIYNGVPFSYKIRKFH